MPEQFVAAKVADAIGKVESVENLRFLVVRPEGSASELARMLEDRGAIVDEVASYRTEPETLDLNGAAARFEAEGADWITFASGSAVQHFHERFNLAEVLRRREGLRTLAIGPETTKALKALGVEPSAEARVHTIEGMVTTLVGRAGRSKGPRA